MFNKELHLLLKQANDLASNIIYYINGSLQLG